MKPKKEIHPPKWADAFLSWFCADSVIETLRGDLYELYLMRRAESSKAKADLAFVGDVISSIRPFAFKKGWSKHSNTNAMFRNNLKVAWRGLVKHKMYSFIKIGGLAIGIAACLLISLFVVDELSRDSHYVDAERIFRLINVETNPADPGKWAAHQPMIAGVMKEQFPEVELAGRLIPYSGWSLAGSNQLRRSDRKQNTFEEGFAYGDQELLDILQIPMVYGTRETALAEPNSIVLSLDKAEKYFPGENPVGQTIILDERTKRPFTIGGVMENPNKLGHLPYDFYITLTGEEFWNGEQTNWCCSNYNVYMKLAEGTKPDVLEEKMVAIFKNSYGNYLRAGGNKYADEVEKYRSYELQPIADIHLYSKGIGDAFPVSDIRIVWLFSAIAVFILLLACINFINLSTAKSANRAKEVGLRKVVGSVRSNLVGQFLTESLLVTCFATFVGLVVAWLLLPFFSMLSGKELEMPFTEWQFYPAIAALILVVGFCAGIYPSFYLSSFRPIQVLRGSVSRGAKTSTLRGVMVVFQFACSMILLVSSIVVYNQMKFILNKDLGYDKDQVLMIEGANTLGDKLPLFQSELKQLPEVTNVSASSYLPVSGTKRDGNAFWKYGRKELDNSIGAQVWNIDHGYLETLGMNLVAGRPFDQSSSRDSTSLIINQRMAIELGLDDPIGEKIENWRTWTVIGVVEDFHFESIRGEISPLAFRLGRFGSVVPVKVNAADMKETLEKITSVWDSFMPNQPIRYTFLDDEYASMYEDVARTGNVFTGFAVLAILVACLGLFGLSAFMVEQRSKEISIRKVLGATITKIFGLLTFNFLKLVLISFLIAVPVSYFLMEEWLADFQYKVDLEWWVFVTASIVVTLIAVATISFESFKAAVVNPAKGLRSE